MSRRQPPQRDKSSNGCKSCPSAILRLLRIVPRRAGTLAPAHLGLRPDARILRGRANRHRGGDRQGRNNQRETLEPPRGKKADEYSAEKPIAERRYPNFAITQHGVTYLVRAAEPAPSAWTRRIQGSGDQAV